MTFAPTPELREERRRTLFITAVAVPAFAIADTLLLERVALLPLLVRLSWAATLIACGAPLLRVAPRAYHALLFIAAVTSPLYYGLICALVGGANTPLFGWGLALPVGVAALIEEELGAVIGACVTSVLTGAVLLLVAGTEPSAFALWMLLYAASIFIAVRASVAYRNHRRAELAHRTVREELNKSEKRREQSERLALIGQLAAGVAHEVRNPLSIAMLQLDFLEKEAANSDRVESVKRALEKVRQIIDDLRTFSRASPESVTLEPVSPAAVVAETVRLADVKISGIAKVEQRLSDALPSVRAQPRQLSQVLLNLLVNAADSLEEHHRSDPVIRVAATAEDGVVRITVEDNGPGIPEHVLPRLFEPFFTTKADKGTGLGLALSREYVERFGGTISAENRAEGGARFTIELPVARRS